MSNIVPFLIDNVTIRQDSEGRFCLNDLHKSAGDAQKHRPKYWLENQQTKDLIVEIEKGGIPPIQSKQGLGTFVAKELVYSYAMWISAEFNLKVIRAYDAMVMFASKGLPPMDETVKAVAYAFDYLHLSNSAKVHGMSVVFGQYGVDIKALPNYAIDAPAGTEIVGSSEPVLAATDLLKQHGIKMSAIAFNKILAHDGYLEKMSRHSSSGKTKHYQSVTEKGLQYGKNVTSDKNQKETQPQWYISKFTELLSVVGLLELKAA